MRGMVADMRQSEVDALKDQVIDLWCQGLDTKDIAERLRDSFGPEHRLSEAWCYRIIIRWREEQLAAGISTERKA